MPVRKRSPRSLVMLVALFTLTPFGAHAAGERAIDFVTFNVRWFGSHYKNPRAEHPVPIDPDVAKERVVILKHFVEQVVKPVDVMQFEEVTDVKLLKKILPKGWSCASYAHENRSHQKIAICASPAYKLVKVPYDDNMTIEEVAQANDKQWSRPALRIDLADLDGNRIARFVGVHLKAMPFYSFERARQMKVIADDLARDRSLPVIVAGDMNTYLKDQTKRSADDVDFLTFLLRRSDKGFRHVKLPGEYTFRSPRYRSAFDHVMVNGLVKTSGTQIFTVCNRVRDGVGFLNFKYYYEYVSDHCPVRVKLKVPRTLPSAP